MVELYSLTRLGNKNGDLTGIDQDVAQLEFESSTLEQSLFASLALADAGLISTDSLDMEKLHLRCETNKNDYKLTFEDSGQWTTSGLAGSPGDDDSSAAIDDGPTITTNLTTWGRMRATEPPLDDKTTSLPELSAGSESASSKRPETAPRPQSLVANFVERQPTDYEYSETYVDGRYLDVNENEVGFVPPSTASIQRSTTSTTRQPVSAPLKPPRRTFADLGHGNPPTTTTPIRREDSGIAPTPNDAAPDLKFLSLPFEVPAFCQQQSTARQIPTLDDLLRQTRTSHLADLDDKALDAKMAEFVPDSGLGSAASCSDGPAHIEDWASLSMLLPKHVVEACSFFKTNSHVLTSSSNKQVSLFSGSAGGPTRTSSTGVPRSSSHQRCCKLAKDTSADSGFGSRSRKAFCDCQTTQSLMTAPSTSATSACASSKLSLNSRLKLHAKELSLIGLPKYDSKRTLVERVVQGVAEISRGATSGSLCAALEALLADGLNPGLSCWDMIVGVTAPGPVTSGQGVFQVVKDLEASEKPAHARAKSFFKQLLKMSSLDGWLSYVVLKENVLSRLYTDSAFMLGANTAYRSLFWRLIESLELLTVLEQRPRKRDSGVGAGIDSSTCTWGSASRIASDSRVPKSSSVPSKLVSSSNPPPTTSPTPTPADPCPERPSTLQIQVPATPVAPKSTPVTVAQAPKSPSPAPTMSSAASSVSPSPSTSSTMRRSRIPVPSAGSASLDRSRTPAVSANASPTRLPQYRRQYQYGARAISAQRPLTAAATPVTIKASTPATGLCRFDARRPGTAVTTPSRVARKYLA
uniref:RUN domain-containing protein n=1 Tax=Panagrellus redivivus TaxID=6233 RepID=A0A7E4UNU5_PANRE